MEQHKEPNTFIFLIETGVTEAFGVNDFLTKKKNPNNQPRKNQTKKSVLGKIYRTLVHEAALHLGESCSNLNMKYLQKQACLETKRNESN